jgi:hypothetical protein
MMFALARSTTRHSSRTAFVRSMVIHPLVIRSFASASGGQLEVTKEIQIDHDNVRDLFDRCIHLLAGIRKRAYSDKFRYKIATALHEKKIIANTLIREMSIHGDAEYDYFALFHGTQF